MQRHGFHLVDPSPWPILASISLLGLCMGLVAWFQFFYLSIFLLIFSFLTLGYVASIWWRDVI
jgi:cytochrome c oxidase subunit 3